MKVRDTMDQTQLSTGYIFLMISFKLDRWVDMAEISSPYGFGSHRVKIMIQSRKCPKIFTRACVQAACHSSF